MFLLCSQVRMGWGVVAWNRVFCHMTDLSCQSQSQYVIRAVWFGFNVAARRKREYLDLLQVGVLKPSSYC